VYSKTEQIANCIIYLGFFSVNLLKIPSTPGHWRRNCLPVIERRCPVSAYISDFPTSGARVTWEALKAAADKS